MGSWLLLHSDRLPSHSHFHTLNFSHSGLPVFSQISQECSCLRVFALLLTSSWNPLLHRSCSLSFFFLIYIYFLLFFFFNFWLCCVFVSVRGLSLVVASGGHSSLRCAGLSLSWALLLRSTSSKRAGSVVVAHGPSCSVACGILPDQGSNLCPLHWQADSQPLRHQGSPDLVLLSPSNVTFFLRLLSTTLF